MSSLLEMRKSDSKVYWNSELQEPLPLLALPAELSHDSEVKNQIETKSITLKQTSSIAILNFTKEKKMSAETFLLSTYFLWLYRLTNEKDIMLGYLHPNNYIIPIRISFEECKTFTELASLVETKISTANYHMDSDVKEWLTSLAPTPYLTIFAINKDIRNNDVHLAWDVDLNGEFSRVTVNYQGQRFSEETVERFISYYKNLIQFLLEADSMNVSLNNIPIISTEEQLLYKQLNQTSLFFNKEDTIHQAFIKSVQKFPERIAISSSEGSLTYKELDEKSNQVAHMLLENGLTKESLVPIFMRRSLQTIISLLGVMKAGGAYVPLDPEHPNERNQYIVEDSNAEFALIESSYSHQFAQLLCTNQNVRVFTEQDSKHYSTAVVNISVSSNDLAYVIYTSGSTGRPKGALIRHIGVLNLIAWSTKEMKFTEEDVLCQFAPYSFDASIYDTFSALFNGAKLYLLSSEERMSVVAFADAIQREGITSIAILPTIFFNELVTKLPVELTKKFQNVRQITIAGETLIMEMVKSFQLKFGLPMDIYNLYGPTECTVLTTFYKVNDNMPPVASVPIGYPLPNKALYIVNEHNQLCPIGVTGELLISSVGVARSYLHQPEKTAEVFVENEFDDDFSPILYRSGDMVRLLADGSIEYVCRKDSQIKIRGHRIEIGEVEDAISKYKEIRDVAVIPKRDDDGFNILVGFMTSLSGTELSQAEVRAFLSERIPSYMIPTHIQWIEEMPVSPTGKIDRRSLAKYEIKSIEHIAENLPRTETEQVIWSAWREALSIKELDIFDNFFEIGGHSLKILETLVLIKPKFPQLKINDFFLYPTVADLASRAEELQVEARCETPETVNERFVDLEECPVTFGSYPETPLLAQNHVLLTGATGYLGSHILQQMLTETTATIYCIVRSESKEQAKERVLERLTYYFGQELALGNTERIIAVPGDLEKDQLGLTELDHRYLQQQIDSIIHCGADVRHYGDIEHFTRVNKQSTEFLLDFARKKQGLRFHFISTIGIPEELALAGDLHTIKGMNDWFDQSVDNVYVNSKLESEKLLYQAAEEEGLPITIYRPGNLTCNSKNGVFQKNIDSNAYYRMLKTMLTLKVAPRVNWYVDFTPIDYASASIVALSKQTKTVGCVLHICNHTQIAYSEMIDMLGKCGYPIELKDPMEYEQWLFSDSSIDPDVLQLTIAQLEGDGAKNSKYRYACVETKKWLQNTKVICPKINDQFFKKMIQYAVEIGYFPEA